MSRTKQAVRRSTGGGTRKEKKGKVGKKERKKGTAGDTQRRVGSDAAEMTIFQSESNRAKTSRKEHMNNSRGASREERCEWRRKRTNGECKLFNRLVRTVTREQQGTRDDPEMLRVHAIVVDRVCCTHGHATWESVSVLPGLEPALVEYWERQLYRRMKPQLMVEGGKIVLDPSRFIAQYQLMRHDMQPAAGDNTESKPATRCFHESLWWFLENDVQCAVKQHVIISLAGAVRFTRIRAYIENDMEGMQPTIVRSGTTFGAIVERRQRRLKAIPCKNLETELEFFDAVTYPSVLRPTVDCDSLRENQLYFSSSAQFHKLLVQFVRKKEALRITVDEARQYARAVPYRHFESYLGRAAYDGEHSRPVQDGANEAALQLVEEAGVGWLQLDADVSKRLDSDVQWNEFVEEWRVYETEYGVISNIGEADKNGKESDAKKGVYDDEERALEGSSSSHDDLAMELEEEGEEEEEEENEEDEEDEEYENDDDDDDDDEEEEEEEEEKEMVEEEDEDVVAMEDEDDEEDEDDGDDGDDDDDEEGDEEDEEDEDWEVSEREEAEERRKSNVTIRSPSMYFQDIDHSGEDSTDLEEFDNEEIGVLSQESDDRSHGDESNGREVCSHGDGSIGKDVCVERSSDCKFDGSPHPLHSHYGVVLGKRTATGESPPEKRQKTLE